MKNKIGKPNALVIRTSEDFIKEILKLKPDNSRLVIDFFENEFYVNISFNHGGYAYRYKKLNEALERCMIDLVFNKVK